MRSSRRFGHTLSAATLALAVVMLAWAPPAMAFPRGGGHGGAAMALEHAADLGLTQEQIQQVEALQAKQREAGRHDHDALKARRETLKSLLSAESIDRAAAEREIDGMVKDMSELHRNRLQARLDLAEILTPDQRETLRGFAREKRGHHKRR